MAQVEQELYQSMMPSWNLTWTTFKLIMDFSTGKSAVFLDQESLVRLRIFHLELENLFLYVQVNSYGHGGGIGENTLFGIGNVALTKILFVSPYPTDPEKKALLKDFLFQFPVKRGFF